MDGIGTPRFILSWREASASKRLWLASCGMALFVFTFAACDAAARLRDPSPQLSLGHDFLPVYAAGELIRQGGAARLYDIEPMAAIERRVAADANLEPDPLYGPFLNPPFFALAYVPFAAMPYRQAAVAWLGLNFLLLAGAVFLLWRMLPADRIRRDKWLVPLLLVLPIPFWQAMCHQQNTFLSLFLLCALVTLWRQMGAEMGRGTNSIYSPAEEIGR